MLKKTGGLFSRGDSLFSFSALSPASPCGHCPRCLAIGDPCRAPGGINGDAEPVQQGAGQVALGAGGALGPSAPRRTRHAEPPCRAPPWPARVAMGTGCVWFWEPRVCAVFPHAKGAPVQHALRCSVLGSRSTDGHVSGPGIPFPAEPCCRLSLGPDAGGSVPSAPHLTWHRPPARRWNSHTRQSPRAAFQKMPRAPGPASPGQHVAPACLKAAVPPRGV